MKDPRDKIRDPDCELCKLHSGAEHVCLLGSGPTRSNIMVVGEAPGAREDDEHAAFVGKAGKELDALLDEVGLNRSEVYVTNAAKCRPPENRTPTKPEIKTCTQAYLAEEIEMVQPELILALGNPALYSLTGKSGIKRHRGLVKPLNAKAVGTKNADQGLPVVFPTYHPAYVLRNPSIRPEVLSDLHRFARMARGEKMEQETTVRLILTKRNLAWLLQKLATADLVSWDIETYTEWTKGDPVPEKPGLQEWHGADSMIVSCSFSWEPGQAAVIPLHHVKSPWKDPDAVWLRIGAVMQRDDAKYIAHNGKFDSRWSAEKGVRIRQDFDTMLAAHMLDENRSKGLKQLSQITLGADAYDVGEELGNARYMPLKRLCVYNGKDTDYTLRLYYVFREQLKQEQRAARVFKFLMMPASNVLVDIERHGIWIDPERWAIRRKFAERALKKIYGVIERHWPKTKDMRVCLDCAERSRAKKKQSLWDPEDLMLKEPEADPDQCPKCGSDNWELREVEIEPINLNSPQQVARLLFSELGLDIVERNKKDDGSDGAPSTREAVLLRLAKEHDAPKALIKYRKWAKRINTYFDPWMHEHSDDDHRVHGSYKLFGTVTGRLSGEGGIQQVPRDPFMRSLFGAPPGRKFIQADFSQIELRIAAMLAHERRMLRMYSAGEDLHMNTAMQMTGKRKEDVTKEERKKAKAVNFGFLYGMGAEKFVDYAFENYEVEVSLNDANRFRDRFFEAYPALRPWHDRQRRLARRYKRVHSPLGRVRHLPDIDSGEKSVASEAERQAINSPVQSCASDLMLLAACQLAGEIDVGNEPLDPDDGWIVGTVHDSLLFDVADDYVLDACRIIKTTMEDLYPVKKLFGTAITVPIVVDVEVGQHWGEATHAFNGKKLVKIT
jgi:uracil-DNA glycosylase family 4